MTTTADRLYRLADRRWLALAAALSMAAASAVAVAAYPGSRWLALLFCLVSGGLVPLGIAHGESPFRMLSAAFLALGFWAKFVAHFAIGAILVEPVGAFPWTPAAWDTVLGFSTAGLAGVWVALLATWRLRLAPRAAAAIGAGPLAIGPDGPAPAPAAPADRRARLAAALLAASSLPALAVFVANHELAILRIGFVPTVALPAPIYGVVAFSITWGILLWTLALTWWLVAHGRLAPTALVYVATIEGAAAALSMSSRAQMLLHIVAAGFALWHGLQWCGWRVGRRGWLQLTAVCGPLFAATLLLVSFDRAVSYAVVLKTLPADSTYVRKAGGNDPKRNVNVQVRRLFVLRWVGLEGVMATVSSGEALGAPLLRRALVEPPAAGIDALYQRMAQSIYPRSGQFVFLTIPGPVAFAAFGGSHLACAAILALLVLAGTAFEHAAGRVTGNPAVAAVTGTALAYLLVQLNFPRTLWVFAIELGAVVLALAWLGRQLRPCPGRDASGPRGGR